MTVTTVITETACIAAVAFNVRFLIALREERKAGSEASLAKGQRRTKNERLGQSRNVGSSESSGNMNKVRKGSL
jgi:hypothetical protein